ncbi:unnamed protein product [Fusarium venenatum]|uniref:Uncharacterized protein n=1 Tax=Fusarium venenatum TaxID=56646 RepID=A0A2L2T0H2_9HYPO|nr:uncharacterized protein FVRRES_05269 [Fusarium venenatum]CEI60833.1 unnamed protein product [Fusarium venenatum]
MRMKEVVSYTTDVTGSNGTAVANIVVVIIPIRDGRGIMRFRFPAVAAIKDVVDDFLCGMLFGLTAP